MVDMIDIIVATATSRLGRLVWRYWNRWVSLSLTHRRDSHRPHCSSIVEWPDSLSTSSYNEQVIKIKIHMLHIANWQTDRHAMKTGSA